MTVRQDRALALAVGGVLALAFTLWAAFTLAGWSIGSVARSEHHVLRGDIRQVRVDGTSGDIAVVPSAGSEVVVDGRAKGSLWMPKMSTRVDGDQVRVNGGCHVVVFGSCDVRFVVHVPSGVAVSVRATSGDVTASDLRSPVVSARSASGDIEIDVADVPRSVDAVSSSGDVTIAVPRGTYAADADTASGDRQIEVASAPDAARSLRAVTSSGDARILYR